MGKDDDKIKTTIFTSKGTRRASGYILPGGHAMMGSPHKFLDGRKRTRRKITTKSLPKTHLRGQKLTQYGSLYTVKLDSTIAEIDQDIFHGNTEIVIEFSGTISEWEKIKKQQDWASGCKCVIIVCIDGIIDIKF